MSKRIGLIIGTRPEAIKVAPLVEPMMQQPEVEPVVVLSGQHREVVADVLREFDITVPEPLLDDRRGRSLSELASELLVAFDAEFDRLDLDMVVVHGDTATAFAGGLAAYFTGIPVAHLEAGLRSGNMAEPFPEEFNRVSIDSYAEVCLAPTLRAAQNLAVEGVDEDRVFITGNTVVDALHLIQQRERTVEVDAVDCTLAHPGDLILATAHRRESWGDPMAAIMEAIVEVAEMNPAKLVAFVMHPNPALQDEARRRLGDTANVSLLPPVPYGDLATLLSRATLVLTDSGGIQEEACALNIPTVVLRERTERPEAVDAGVAVLAGIDYDAIVSAARLLRDRNAATFTRDVFGDGQAAQRCAQAIAFYYGLGARPAPFVPDDAVLEIAA